MSAVQKKRKGGGRRRGESGGPADAPPATVDSDEDDKALRKRPGTGSGGCMNRVCMVFVVVLCLIFYDVAHVNKTIYKNVFHVSSRKIVDEASRKSQSKYHSTGLNRIVDDTRRIETLLVRSGAVNKPHMEFETERINRVLHGEAVNAMDDSEDNSGKESMQLFKSESEVLEMEEQAAQRIAKRAGKAVFTMRHGGYDLGTALLRGAEGAEPVHTGKTLEDFVQLAEEHAVAEEEKAEKATRKIGSGAAAAAGGETAVAAAPSDAAPADAKAVVVEEEQLSRKMAFAKRTPPPEFEKFLAELRVDNTYAHLGRKNDMERALKLLGYKQSTKSSRKAPMWFGTEDKGKCPAFKKEETRISFCPYFIPQNKADQFAHIQAFAEKVPKAKLKPDFYPLTWRLYKEQERRQLKLHCTNESMSEFGEAYVRKFTVPGSNYMKSAESIYDQLVKSDKKVKELTKETKNRAIVQLYINNPLLIEERKFIIRTFAVIVAAKPFIVFYHDGAVFRSIVKYKPFARHDSDYKKAAHITSEQKSAQKKVLKSSELYTSFNSLQTYLTRSGHPDTYVNSVLRPQMKARMIYALYAILKRQRSSDDDAEAEASSVSSERGEGLPPSVAVLQTTCFDFLLDEKKTLYLITVATGPHCFINMGGSSFRPAWKVKLQDALSENTAKLSEEVLWRRMNKKPISTMKFFTETGMTVLIDETFPDWDVTNEINAHMEGVQVEQDNKDYNTPAENDEEEIASIIGRGGIGGGIGGGGGGGDEEDDEEEADEEEEP